MAPGKSLEQKWKPKSWTKQKFQPSNTEISAFMDGGKNEGSHAEALVDRKEGTRTKSSFLTTKAMTML